VFAASVSRFYALNGCFDIEDGRQQSSDPPVNTASYLGSLGCSLYRGAEKSLARAGGKQATATEDFDVHISYL
jgi:hypothetical protein